MLDRTMTFSLGDDKEQEMKADKGLLQNRILKN